MRTRPPLLFILMLSLILGVSSASAGFALAKGDSLGVNLDQWANADNEWQNGDLNGSNSAYAEGDVVPFRLAIDGLTSGVHTIHINWDVTSGSHAAYDFLASYNVTESPDLCAAGGGGVSGLCPSLPTPYPLNLFTDNLTIDGKTIAGAYGATPRVMRLYGVRGDAGHTPFFGTPSYTDGGHYTGDVLLTFETTTSSDVLLAWGGHIAQTSYWTPDPQGAGMVSGAPWHMRTQQLDGNGNKNQDRSIQTSALPDPVITVTKYQDTNGNGSRQEGEPGLSQWTFTVYDSHQHSVGTITTGASGSESLTLDDSGTYSVVETLKAGWTSTDPGGATPTKMVVAPRGTTQTVLFGNKTVPPPNGTIRIFKYSDVNNNGSFDTGDTGLSGWSFTVKDGQGTTVGTITTIADGSGTLSIAAGSYTIFENLPLPANWANTDPTGATPSKPVTVTSGEQTGIVYFGNHYTAPPTDGTILVRKYNDENGNGGKGGGEPYLPGWTFNVTSGSTQIGSILTNADGFGTLIVAAGTYTVTEVGQANWSNTEPGTGVYTDVVVTAGQTTEKVFGNHYTEPDGSLVVFKYNDEDNSGHQDEGEPGLAGWDFTVQLLVEGEPSGDPQTITTGSDPLGETPPLSLAPGRYRVCEIVKESWSNTDPGELCQDVDVYSIPAVTIRPVGPTRVTFGNYQTPPGYLSVFKYDDLDNDGVRDLPNGTAGESGLPDFSFTIQPLVEGSPVGDPQTVTTGSDGYTTPVQHEQGTYRVCEIAQAGWTQTQPAAGACFDIAIANGQRATVTFGNHYTPVGTLRVFKYNDLDNDGAYDAPNGTAGEPGLSGWGFTVDLVALTHASIQQVITTGSDPLGYAEIALSAGTYHVCEQTPLPSYWTNTDPAGTMCKDVNVANNETTTAQFGNHYAPPPPPPPPPFVVQGSLLVTKYNDANRNGALDTGEVGLAGWTFNVSSGSTIVRTLTTDANGNATASSLGDGSYTVTEVTQTGWISTDPGTSTPMKTVSVTSGSQATVVFGNAIVLIPSTTQTQIIIVKYADTNANGVRDTDEGALANFTFSVRDNTGALVRTAVTGADGFATLLNLPLGTYAITEEPRDGWVNTEPGGSATRVINLTATATSATIVFGNAEVRLPSTATDDGTTGTLLLILLLGGLALAIPMGRRAARRT